MNRRQHWNDVYTTKGERDVSWYEPSPAISLALMEAAGITRDSCVIDVGGGESRLADALVERGLRCIAVLDVAHHALEHARQRLGDAASIVTWIEADVTADWSWKPVDIWHDRAVLHFLTGANERAQYRERLSGILKPGGSAIIATFALEGPEKCSGLPVVRYSAESLAAELGKGFELAESRHHLHTTPWGATQAFQYSRFRKT